MHWYRHMTYIACRTLRCRYKIVDCACKAVTQGTFTLPKLADAQVCEAESNPALHLK